MKRFLFGHSLLGFLIAFLVVINLSGCKNETLVFNEEVTIDNGFYNYISGGNLAYINNSLYIVKNTDMLYIGSYRINNEGTRSLFDDSAIIDFSFTAPSMYQCVDSLFLYYPENRRYYLYNCEENKLSENALNFQSGNGVSYISEDLCLYFTDDAEHLMVKYKDNEAFQLDTCVLSFCVYEEKIYFISDKGWLYFNDPSLLNPECVFVNSLNQNGILSKIIVCDGYCYYTDDGSEKSNFKPGLYRYSFKNDISELVIQKNILSLNQHKNTVYFATQNGIYFVNENECKKISEIATEELYIFGDRWIYTNDNNGNIFRLSEDGKVLEKIKI